MMFSRLLQAVGVGQVRGELPARILQHAGDSDACGTYTPEDGSPMAIVVGARAPVDKLRNLAARHGLEVDALVLFARRH